MENQLILNTIASSTVTSLATYAGLYNLKIQDASIKPFIVPIGDSQDTAYPKFISKLNTVVYSNIIINKFKPSENPNNLFTWDDFQIDDILMVVSQSKKIVTTEIQGKDGTVKEYIGLDDYVINFTGRISGSYGVYEKELVAALKKILSAGQPLAVSSWWLQNLDITEMVVTGFDFGQTEGEYSTQYFTFTAISDNKIIADLITLQ